MQLLQAADHSDVLAALAVLRPAEREAIEPGLSGLVSQLERLGILAGASLSRVNGVTLGFSNVTTRTFAYGPDLVAVQLTGGTVQEGRNISQLPIGAFLRQHLGSISPATRAMSESASTGRSVIATVKSNGRWYVSLGYTIAIDALRSKGRFGAPPAAGITPTGSTTAEGAVTKLLTSLASLDLGGMIADLSPGEMGALQSYAPMFVSRAEAGIAQLRQRDHLSLSIANETYSTRPVGAGTLVTVRSLDYTVTIGTTQISYANGCTTTTVNGVTTKRCASPSGAVDLGQVPPALRPVVQKLVPILKRLSGTEIGFVVSEENGRYYISPLGTLFADANGVLSQLQPGDMTTLVDVFRELKALVANSSIGSTTLD